MLIHLCEGPSTHHPKTICAYRSKLATDKIFDTPRIVMCIEFKWCQPHAKFDDMVLGIRDTMHELSTQKYPSTRGPTEDPPPPALLEYFEHVQHFINESNEYIQQLLGCSLNNNTSPVFKPFNFDPQSKYFKRHENKNMPYLITISISKL